MSDIGGNSDVYGSHGQHIHPSVSSRIIDNTTVFISGTGATKLLAAFPAEKGPDRVAVSITTPEEFIFNFGEPDMRRYGQTAYNVVEWLRNSGEAICIRVTADGRLVDGEETLPAFYANSIFSVVSNRHPVSPVSKTPVLVEGTPQISVYDFAGTNITGGVSAQAASPATAQVTRFEFTDGVTTPGSHLLRLHPEDDPMLHLLIVLNETAHSDVVDMVAAMVTAINDGSNRYLASVDQDTNGDDTILVVTDRVPGPQSRVLLADSPVGSGINFSSSRVPGEREVVGVDAVDPTIVVDGETVPVSLADDGAAVASAISTAFTNSTSYDVTASGTIVEFRSTFSGVRPSVVITQGPKTGGLRQTHTLQRGTEDTPDPEALRSEWVYDAFDTNGGGVITVGDGEETFESNNFASVDLGSNVSAVTGAFGTGQIIEELNALNGTDVFDGNEFEHRLFAVVPFGRGRWYNNIGFRLTANLTFNEVYDFMMYTFDVVERVRGTDVVVESFDVALSPDAVGAGGESLHISEVVNTYSQYVRVFFNEAGYDSLGDRLEVNPDVLDVVTWRPLTDVTATWEFGGIERTRVVDAIERTGLLTNYTRVPASNVLLEGGTDGNFELTTQLSTNRLLLDQLLADAYVGITDPQILDKIALDIDVLLDANYSGDVKLAMVDFASRERLDCMAILDTNHLATPIEAVNYRRSVLDGINTPYAAIFTQAYLVRDTYHGRDTEVTATYFLASKIPTNDTAYGVFRNFVGPRRGVIEGFRAVNFVPTPTQKDLLYKAQVNYMEADRDFYNLGSQLTTRRSNSVMSNISVARMLFRMQRQAETVARNFRFEFFNAETYSILQKNIEEALNPYVAGGGVRNLSVEVYASEYDRVQKILRVRIGVVFEDIIERIFIDFVLNR